MYKKWERWNPEKLLGILLLVSSAVIYGSLILQGKYFIYLDVGSDTMHSFYPIYRYAAACIREGAFSQWSFAIGTGATTFNYTSVMMDPFAWPVILAGALLGDQVFAMPWASLGMWLSLAGMTVWLVVNGRKWRELPTLLLLLTLCTMTACGTAGAQQSDPDQARTQDNLSILTKAGFVPDHYHVPLVNSQRQHHFVVVNDLHILVSNEEVREDVKDMIQTRYELEFVDDQGTKSSDLWKSIVKTINKMDVDGVILAADMIDFYSEANVAALREGCQDLKVPFMLLRADHDYTDGYVEATPWEVIEAAHKTIDGHEDVMVMEYEDFMLVGLNNTTSQLSGEAFDQLQDLFAAKKPMVMVSHVPFASQVDTGLSDRSKEAWNGLELLWAYNGFPFHVGEDGEALMDMMFAPDSPVAAVLGGHLHFAYDGPLTETVHQHVFDASYKGTLGYVTVGSTKQ